MADLFRLEIEPFFLHPLQITSLHEKTAKRVIPTGMGIYATVTLIRGLKDTQPIMTKMAHQLRNAGIQFHFIVIDGLMDQVSLNRPPFLYQKKRINIAPGIRRSFSGLKIPLYGIQTDRGIRMVDLYDIMIQR